MSGPSLKIREDFGPARSERTASRRIRTNVAARFSAAMATTVPRSARACCPSPIAATIRRAIVSS